MFGNGARLLLLESIYVVYNFTVVENVVNQIHDMTGHFETHRKRTRQTNSHETLCPGFRTSLINMHLIEETVKREQIFHAGRIGLRCSEVQARVCNEMLYRSRRVGDLQNHDELCR